MSGKGEKMLKRKKADIEGKWKFKDKKACKGKKEDGNKYYSYCKGCIFSLEDYKCKLLVQKVIGKDNCVHYKNRSKHKKEIIRMSSVILVCAIVAFLFTVYYLKNYTNYYLLVMGISVAIPMGNLLVSPMIKKINFRADIIDVILRTLILLCLPYMIFLIVIGKSTIIDKVLIKTENIENTVMKNIAGNEVISFQTEEGEVIETDTFQKTIDVPTMVNIYKIVTVRGYKNFYYDKAESYLYELK